ncbi:two-component system, NarL family, invasion response regulator [Methylomarinovum caldicuralii]|uniref:Two-component system, NarL family, invasion response regulator n=1 Tax=Methylomarinovum caldicuralii TaxID=438856 RepID=A0AAU9C881_9GAMM|nr:response regulator transcription factor [Methylomarinovum caldicuralii]BCX81651.1 two-component system, NarL family, invasion response regulator [Methylomarinovum caldicuralii]
MKPVRILLVDDHPVVRSGLRRYLEMHPDLVLVGEANQGKSGYHAFVSLQPDVTLLDIALPDVSGLEILRRICQRDPQARILLLSMYENSLLMERALQNGACGYLSKRHGPEFLVTAIRRIAAGETVLDPELEHPRVREHCAALSLLTQREFEVFRQLAEGRSVKEIAQRLHLSEKTVGVHRTRIFKKLKLENVAQLTLLAVRCQVIVP